MNTEQKRILIMEDSDIFADMLLEFLASLGCVVERAVNGFDGFKKVYSFMPHIIITDVEMPLFKGYQVTRLLKARKNTRSIPVIMYTTLGEAKDKFWGGDAGADIYIEKAPDNFQPLHDAITQIFSESRDIDFSAIERESKRINDNSIIELMNNLLDKKLFQTTIIGMLAKLSDRAYSLEMTVEKILSLLNNVCEAEIVSLMVLSAEGALYVYTANFAGFTVEIVDDFFGISVSDFNNMFPDFKVSNTIAQNLLPAGNNKKKVAAYITIPLIIGGNKFASVHIANTIGEYFSPSILENINVFLGAAAPIVANSLSTLELLELQKKTRTAFARYVPADVMDEIISESSKKVAQSENKYVSVLFSDIRDFTAISEHSDAQLVVEFLNNYFSKMGSEIISEGGHVDKFMGDAIMAVFGAFRNLENSPVNAVRAAIKMLAALDGMNAASTALSHDNIQIGIGINYGNCVLGNIGFQGKMDYTVIGDAVNVAARIESLAKSYRHPLIVSEYVYDVAKNNFLFRKVDNVRVKGKGEPVAIYAVYSGFRGAAGNVLRTGEVSDLPSIPSLLVDRGTLVNYNKGLSVFYMREWKLAEEYFSKALEADENDYLSQLYLNRTIEFARKPPPDTWDGVVTLAEK
ncbi:MAG: response regulator [Spirochaetaceae bacterium]|nr:response regulator [Spirochaetaceae bacterium]